MVCNSLQKYKNQYFYCKILLTDLGFCGILKIYYIMKADWLKAKSKQHKIV